MGFHKPHDKENPPASTLFQVHDEIAQGICQGGDAHSGGVMQGSFSSNADLTSSPFMSLPPAHSHLANINDPFRSHTFMKFNDMHITSGENLIRLHGPPIATSSINIRNDAPRFLGPPEVHHDSTGYTGEVHRSTNDCNRTNADSVINQGGFRNPYVNMKSLSSHAAVEEANSFGLDTLQSTAGPPNIWNKMSVLQHAQNIEGAGSKNDFQLIDTQFSSPRNIERRFHTPGMGGNRQPLPQRSRTKCITKEIAGKLDETVFQCTNYSPIRQIRSSLIPAQSFVGGISNLQSDAYAGSGPAYSLGSSTFLANADAAMRRLSESSFSISQTEQIAEQHHSSVNSGGRSGFVGKTSLGYSQLDLPQDFLVESSNPACVTAQRAAEQPPSSTNIARNMLPESIYSHIPVGNGSLVGQNHFGGSGTQAIEGSPFLLSTPTVGQQSSSGQVTPLRLMGKSLFPQRMGIQIAERSDIQPAIGNQFPMRFGIQPNGGGSISHAGQEHMPHGVVDTQQTGHCQQRQAQNVVHVQRPMSFSSGPHHGSVPVQTGQGIPTADVNAIPQASNIHGQPSLKRRAHEHPPYGWSRKIVGHHSKPYPGQNLHCPPPIPRASAPALPRVMWQGSERPPQPSGHKCLICKRDVTFTPDGPVYQPSTPPAVAVLPCGHVFHDHCLQNITPKDQSKDPPCIPCATGET